jgi:hypothetical protein
MEDGEWRIENRKHWLARICNGCPGTNQLHQFFLTAKNAKFLAKHAEKNNCQLSIINFQLP